MRVSDYYEVFSLLINCKFLLYGFLPENQPTKQKKNPKNHNNKKPQTNKKPHSLKICIILSYHDKIQSLPVLSPLLFPILLLYFSP